MGERDILVEISGLLAKHKIPYLLTGSFAVSYYGYPRSTHDIDFILEIPKESIAVILKMLAKLNKDYDYSVTDIKDAISKSSQFSIFHLESGIKLDFWIAKNDEFEKSKFVRSKTIRIMGQKISVLSAEDLILNKLKWCKEVRSERHMRDCVGILKVQGEKLDKKYLSYWAKKLDLEDLMDEISTSDY